MGNSVTRARARRNLALAEALRATLGVRDVTHIAAGLRAELAARGLEVADIGGQRADDDGTHRAVPSGTVVHGLTVTADPPSAPTGYTSWQLREAYEEGLQRGRSGR